MKLIHKEVKMQEIVQAVQEIIGRIPKGRIFDSHFVIDQLILRHTSAYYMIIRELANANTNQIHGRIAQVIEEQKQLVKLIGLSHSKHIHGAPGKCAAWQRI
jgi:uncharacterized protein (DUF305 family)